MIVSMHVMYIYYFAAQHMGRDCGQCSTISSQAERLVIQIQQTMTETSDNLMQVVACSFLYGGSKTKTKPVTASKDNESSVPQFSEKVLASPASAPPAQSFVPLATNIWPGSRPGDMKSTHTGIDLMRG